jgi:hypothetical protein
VTLTIADRQGVEIDFCPQCRGVWLDRGELDKIIDRLAATSASTSLERAREYDDDDRYRHSEARRYRDDDDYKYRDRKKRGFLGELFDF